MLTTGAAAWFSSCVGSDYGACGTCRDTSLQAAWQNVTGHVPPCYCSCKDPLYPCGHGLYVVSPNSACSNFNTVSVTIADHGPGACTGTGNDCFAYSGRIMDLTTTAFKHLAPLSKGVISVSVSG